MSQHLELKSQSSIDDVVVVSYSQNRHAKYANSNQDFKISKRKRIDQLDDEYLQTKVRISNLTDQISKFQRLAKELSDYANAQQAKLVEALDDYLDPHNEILIQFLKVDSIVDIVREYLDSKYCSIHDQPYYFARSCNKDSYKINRLKDTQLFNRCFKCLSDREKAYKMHYFRGNIEFIEVFDCINEKTFLKIYPLNPIDRVVINQWLYPDRLQLVGMDVFTYRQMLNHTVQAGSGRLRTQLKHGLKLVCIPNCECLVSWESCKCKGVQFILSFDDNDDTENGIGMDDADNIAITDQDLIDNDPNHQYNLLAYFNKRFYKE